MTDRDERYDHFVREWFEAEAKEWLADATAHPERLIGAPTAFIDPASVLRYSDLTVGRFIKNLVRERTRVVIGRKKATEATE